MVIEAMGDAVIVLGTTGRITYANQQARHRLHRSLAQMQAVDPLALVHPDDLELAAEALGDATLRPGVHTQIELRIDDGEGGWLEVELVGSVLEPDAGVGGPGVVILSARPTGWRHAARAALESIGTGAPLAEILPLIARTALELLSAQGVRIRWDDVEATAGHIERPGWTVGLHGELPISGEIDFGAAPDRPWQADHRSLAEIRRLVAVVSRRETRLERLRFDATHDALTGMNNRRAVQEALAGLAGSGGVALLFVDLDNFKLVNDTYGYERGDEVLREAANRLHEVVGGAGLVGRFGGDEFVVLRRCDARGGEAMAAEIVSAFHQPLTGEDPPLTLTVSVGLVHCPGPPCADRSDELLRDAGTAAHRAKVAGRDRWVRFSPRLHEIAAARIQRTLRQDVQSMHAYAIQPSAGLVKLDAMENPFRLPPELQRALGERLGRAGINRYPVASGPALVERLSAFVQLPAGCKLTLGNGSDELIDILSVACNVPGATLLAPLPGFVMYEMSARLRGDYAAGRIGGTCVTRRQDGTALYFSKAPIPHGANELDLHVGLYGYRPEALKRYAALPVSPLEEAEGLEQLRLLEAGLPVHLVEVALPEGGLWEVNNPEDVPLVEALL